VFTNNASRRVWFVTSTQQGERETDNTNTFEK
jgi:hypothetical protein